MITPIIDLHCHSTISDGLLTPTELVSYASEKDVQVLEQAVFNKNKHLVLDGKEISKTDAKKMLEAYIAVELAGSSNEILRKYAEARGVEIYDCTENGMSRAFPKSQLPVFLNNK